MACESELRRMAEVLIRVEAETSRVTALKVTMQPAETVYNNGGSGATPKACAEINAENAARR